MLSLMRIGHTVPTLMLSFIGLVKVVIQMNRLRGLKSSKKISYFGRHLVAVLLMQPIQIYKKANKGIQADALPRAADARR